MRRLPHPPSREVGVLAAVAFSVAVGYGIVAPVIPEFARTFGVGKTLAAAVVSVFAVMRLVSALLGGRLVDAFGERVVLAAGIGIVAVSSALAGAAQSYAQLLVLRGAGGFGSALFTVSAMSLILRSTAAEHRSRAAGLFGGGFLLGGIVGPGLGSTVAHLGVRAPFFIYAGTLVVAGSIGLLALPRRPGAMAGDAGGIEGRGLRDSLRHPAYRAALAAQLADAWAVLGVRSALVPLFVVELLRVEKHWVYRGFLVVAFVNAAMLWPAGRYSDRRGRRPVLVAGLLLSAASFVGLASAHDLPAYLGSMALLGVGSGLLDVAPAAVVGDVVGGRGGTSIAGYQMAGDAGAVVGPLVAGLLADSLSYGAAFGATAGVLAVAACFALAAPETLTTAKPTDAVAWAGADRVEGS